MVSPHYKRYLVEIPLNKFIEISLKQFIEILLKRFIEISLKYKAYAPEFDNSTGDNITIINSETGEGVAAASTVDMNYTYVNDTYNASNSYSIYLY